MERTLSAEERIRKAEEIYYKRKMQNQGVRVSANASNKPSKPNYKLFNKVILQALICITIYVIFYLVQNSNYIFSDNVLNTIKNILSYDINFQKVYQDLNGYIENLKNKDNESDGQNVENEGQELNETEKNPVTEENIGGAQETTEQETVDEQASVDPNAGLSQMEIDAKYIKENYSLTLPIQGTITSRYGLRNPTTSSVPKNHTGIDIAANTGTVIYAALDGIVKIASSEGDYGNHLRIEKDDIAIYYAHCNKLYVKEGEQIKQGDAIAEVGATGNVTGPHLHFEIRREDRYVNPDLIMQF